MKNVLLISLVLFLFAACGTNKKECCENKCEKFTVDSFFTVADSLDGKIICLEGKIDHVCKHSGRRVTLLGTDSTRTILATFADTIAPMDSTYKCGDMVAVKGTVKIKTINEECIVKMLADADSIAKANPEAEAQKETNDHHMTAQEKADMYRAEMQTLGKTELKMYYLVNVTEYKKQEAGCCSKR